MLSPKRLQQIAKGQFAVGGADRTEWAIEHRTEFLEVAVVGKHPVAAPHLAHEGMAVFQRHPSLRGLAYMRDHVLGLDRALLDQRGNGRGDGGLVVNEMAHPGAFEKGNAPAVIVVVGAAAAGGKAGEAEHDVGRNIAVHSK
jgi:hypothetical protein